MHSCEPFRTLTERLFQSRLLRMITTIENPFADFAFTFETDFELGEHTIKLIATDDTGQ